MDILFFILFCVSFVALIVGLIKPSLVIRGEIEDKKNRKTVIKRYGLYLILFFILFAIAIPTDTEQSTVDGLPDTQSAEIEEQEEVEKEIKEEPKDKGQKKESEIKEIKKVEEPKKDIIQETMSQQQAVRKAKDYLSFTAFSRRGLIEQLEFEGFDEKDATYAVDKIDADWENQAVKKAKDYLSFTAFSRSGLIEQLEFEGFDEKDATYAVDKIDVDWKNQAVKKAKDYLSFTAFSRSGLIDQLIFEGFTEEEATHAVDIVGL